jgi:hypothetical protein
MRRDAARASAVPQVCFPLLICVFLVVSPLAGQGTRANDVREAANGGSDAIATRL